MTIEVWASTVKAFKRWMLGTEQAKEMENASKQPNDR